MSNQLNQSSQKVVLKIRYYASLREQAKCDGEELSEHFATPEELYGALKQRYGFRLGMDQLRVAINGQFSDMKQTLVEGDEVVFIPPVSGG